MGWGEELTKEELGGSEIHAHMSGAVDNEAESEDEAFAQIRRFLSYLPQSVWQAPPRMTPDDEPGRREEELISIVPRNRRHGYDVRRIIELVMDRESFFEMTPFFGPSLITGFARLDGFAVGVMANDPFAIGGSLDGPASDKMVKFIDLCDTFHLPVVNFVDQPGFLIGREAEMRRDHSARRARAVCDVPDAGRRLLRSWCARRSALPAPAMESPPG